MSKSKALEDEKKIILSWKESYLRMARESGGGEWLVKDFESDVDEYAFPYVTRLYQSKIISEEEMKEFLDFCQTQIMELRHLAGEEDKDA
ncbi:MAG: hypothetical protein GTN70_06280 [Deltaproteobacteria bacterium]|nr:hypothetical protein [Deltaproteobacteria bacterium]NIS77288.1 hypothetical protein [Deltaproteobacteria bacterium]